MHDFTEWFKQIQVIGFEPEKADNDFVNQKDFVKTLRQHNAVLPFFYPKVLGDRQVEVAIPLRGNKLARYVIKKDVNDDFMKFEDGDAGTYAHTPTKSNSKNYDSVSGTFNKAAGAN